ncbi:MAG: 2-phospho-L-lactate guanylyltransferase [Dehalococcoidia bacterium]
MIVDALVPVKAATAGKTRLAQLLPAGDRASLIRAMLRDVVTALQVTELLRSVAVLSPDPEMLTLAGQLGALPLGEPPGTTGLNEAVAAGIATLVAGGADGVLFVQGDVPEITALDVKSMLSGLAVSAPVTGEAARSIRLVRAVPSADGGTSAMLLIPPDVIAPGFGLHSFGRHQGAARAARASFERCDLPRLARDIDRPEDLERFLRLPTQSCTATELHRIQADLQESKLVAPFPPTQDPPSRRR